MKIFKQIALILLFYIIGEIISRAIIKVIPAIFIPGSIIGMILLIVAIAIKVIKIGDVDEVGTFLTSNMSFFFIPAAVSVMEYFDVISPILGQIIIIILSGLIVSIFAIAYSVKLTLYLQNKYSKKSGEENA